jgi:HEAT repeats
MGAGRHVLRPFRARDPRKMIASEKLAAWLGSREQQSASHAAVARFVDEWSGGPLMCQLDRELALMTQKTPQAVIAAARRFLDRVEDIEGLIAALIARSAADPFFLPPMHPVTSELHSGILLFHRPELSIAFGVSTIDMMAGKKAGPRRAPGSIVFTGLHNLFRYVKAGNAVLSFWEVARIEAGFSAATAPKCRRTGRRRIADGDEVLTDGSCQSFIVDHAEGDLVYFQVVVRTGCAPLTVEYDADTCSFIGATGTDEGGSRVQMMASLLREMDREDAVPVLREAMAGTDFYIRWHIMREMLALDAEAALPDLRRMAAHDPHPEVRAAAAQTLRLFFAEADVHEEPLACHA